MIAYLDTSAALKLVVEDAESEALATFLTSADDLRLAASWLLFTELHCAANRRPDVVGLDSVTQLLESIVLVDIARGDLLVAGSLPGRLRSNDAIHLATALRVGVDAMLTYDVELRTAAEGAGLATVQPA